VGTERSLTYDCGCVANHSWVPVEGTDGTYSYGVHWRRCEPHHDLSVVETPGGVVVHTQERDLI
jgi:hypothetical protein